MVANKSGFSKTDAAEFRARWSKNWRSESWKLDSILNPEKEAVLLEFEPAAMLRWHDASRIQLTAAQIESAALQAPGQLLKLPSLIHSINRKVLKTCVLKAPRQALRNRTARDHMGKKGIPSIEACIRMLKPKDFNQAFADNPEVILDAVGTSSDNDWIQELFQQTKATWHKAVKTRILSRI
jgi:hypothetical protein